MTKQQRIDKLILHCKELSKLNELTNQKTAEMQRMAQLARQGEKESEEFKLLHRKNFPPSVIDYSDVVRDIVKTVSKL